MYPPVADVLLTALGFLEWPFTGLWLSLRLLTSPSAMRFRELQASVSILSCAAAISESCSSWLSWLEGPGAQVPPSLAGGVNAGSVETVMLVSWEPTVERGWLWVEPSSRSREGLRCIVAAAAAAAAATTALTGGGFAIEAAAAGAVGLVDAIWCETRESASAGPCAARSPPRRAPVAVSVVASGRASAVLNNGGGSVTRLGLSVISPRGRSGVMSMAPRPR